MSDSQKPVAWRFRLSPSKVPDSPWRITDHYEDIRVMVERGEWEAVPLYAAPPSVTGLPHCEKFCEANAFQIEIRRLKAELKERNT